VADVAPGKFTIDGSTIGHPPVTAAIAALMRASASPLT